MNLLPKWDGFFNQFISPRSPLLRAPSGVSPPPLIIARTAGFSIEAPMDTLALRHELMRDEGEVLHAYQDSEGFWTIGVGVLIDARRSGGITHEESQYLLNNRIAAKEAEIKNRLTFWDCLDDVRQRALMNMAYQMGVDGLMQFKNMLMACKAQRWRDAHDECLNSRYAKQTPARANRVADMLLTGKP